MSVEVVPHRSGPQAFFIQYVSLILIILTIVAGTFTRADLMPTTTKSVSSPETPKISLEKPRDITWISESMDISSAVSFSGKPLSMDLVSAWQQVLENHDVGIWVELRVSSLDHQTLQLASNIVHEIAVAGVPDGAIDMRIRTGAVGPKPFKATQRWFLWKD